MREELGRWTGPCDVQGMVRAWLHGHNQLHGEEVVDDALHRLNSAMPRSAISRVTDARERSSAAASSTNSALSSGNKRTGIGLSLTTPFGARRRLFAGIGMVLRYPVCGTKNCTVKEIILQKTAMRNGMNEEIRIFIGRRLKEERDRFGWSQAEFAEIADVSKRSVASWESGESMPGADAMARLAARGVDLLYVVQGERAPVLSSALSDGERALVSNYQRADARGRSLVDGVAELAGGVAGTGRVPAPLVQIGGDVGQHIAGIQTVAGPMTINVGKGRK